MSDEPAHWFEPVADHLGEAYLRYSFTKGTDQEVAFLLDALGLEPGMRVLDVGCGPGRHAHALAATGPRGRRHRHQPAVRRPGRGRTRRRGRPSDGSTLGTWPSWPSSTPPCRSARGPSGSPAGRALRSTVTAPCWQGIARALRPGGRVAVSAFSAYFQLRYLEEQDRFDADAGVNHERTEIRDPAGNVAEADLWTTCFTPARAAAARGRGGAGGRAHLVRHPRRVRGRSAAHRTRPSCCWSPAGRDRGRDPGVRCPARISWRLPGARPLSPSSLKAPSLVRRHPDLRTQP